MLGDPRDIARKVTNVPFKTRLGPTSRIDLTAIRVDLGSHHAVSAQAVRTEGHMEATDSSEQVDEPET